MQIFLLNLTQSILLYVIAWLVIQLAIGYLNAKIPLKQMVELRPSPKPYRRKY